MITGILSWIGLRRSFGPVVRSAHDKTVSPASPSQDSQIPPKPNIFRSRMPMKYGCFLPFVRFHS